MGDAVVFRHAFTGSENNGAGIIDQAEYSETQQADSTKTLPACTALFLGAFFDELIRWGVREVVVSPGSRSTPLAMCAYELSCRCPDRLRLFVDVDERGAAFFALGLAKASGRPVALI